MSLFDTKVEAEPKHTNEELYYKQMDLLKKFLEHNAISKAQYNKSAHDLTEKMGFGELKQQDKRN